MGKNTKEQIKNRMIKTAAEVWGIEANEIETSFDPIISLLLSACSAEIEKISSELNESETRITEKLIELMTPERSVGPTPAHSILYATPIDAITSINAEYHFSYRKKIPHQKTSVKFKEISFTPIQDFNLVDAKIEHMIIGTNHFRLDEKKNREVQSKVSKSAFLPESTILVGVNSSQRNLLLNDVSFYFELLGTEDKNKELFYNHLKNSKWSLNGKALETTHGFYNSIDEGEIIVNNIFEEISHKSDLTHQEILNFYKKNFITIKSSNDFNANSENNNEVNNFLRENNIKTESGIQWIKIEFPTVINNNVLSNVICSLNAFPVVNRELFSFSYQLKDYVHIIPLITENLFFDLKSIVNTDGKQYSVRTNNELSSNKGTFIVRSNSIGKLEQRKAKEYIVYLLELLKDESASFAFLNNDFLLKSLKSLNQQIAVLEKKVDDSIIDQTQTHFAVLSPYKQDDQLLVEFWTTNGFLANNIKSGSELSLSKGIGVKQMNNYFLTTSTGGKDDLKMADRLNSYRRALLTRDRIVTKEDIRVLCYEIYGDKLAKVEIKRGFTKDLELNKGWVPNIQILLTPNKKINKDVWKGENNKLMHILEKKSLNVFPYELKILN
ncbi:hypothetical protein GH721_08900 [Kriegella sp. EG-1]|nr:hypothetical protein [Flavobacteriaceae bacterium EG-1]